MLYLCPPTRAMMPEWSVAPWSTQVSTTVTCCPFAQRNSRAPSSEVVMKVYVSLTSGWIEPVQRAVKWSTLGPGPGGPGPQLKLMVGSTRVRVGLPGNGLGGEPPVMELDQYSPSRPLPLPMVALLMNPALAMPLLIVPGFTAIACTAALFVKVNGPV